MSSVERVVATSNELVSATPNGTIRNRSRVVIPLLLGASVTVAAAAQRLPAQDWPAFGGNVQSTSANPGA